MSHCFFIATSGGNGHIAQQFKMLAHILAQRGHRAVILLDGRRLKEESFTTNPAIYTWPSERPTQVKDAFFLYHLIRQHKPACLISNFGASNVMLLVGVLARIPVRIDWHHTLSKQIDSDAGSISRKAYLQRLRKKLVLNAATNIVAVSKAGCLDMQKAFGVAPVKCVAFYNSLADPYLNSEISASPVEGSRCRIVCVGRFAPTKGQDVLIRSIAILKQDIPMVEVEFLGDGPTFKSCVELAHVLGVSENCIFAGQTTIEKVMKKLSEARVAVVPSRIDMTPTVILESLAVGTPVIASEVGGTGELIRDSIDGFLIPTDDPGAWAEKLRMLLTNDDLRIKLGQNARQRFLSTFEQNKALNELADWLERTVDARL